MQKYGQSFELFYMSETRPEGVPGTSPVDVPIVDVPKPADVITEEEDDVEDDDEEQDDEGAEEYLREREEAEDVFEADDMEARRLQRLADRAREDADESAERAREISDEWNPSEPPELMTGMASEKLKWYQTPKVPAAYVGLKAIDATAAVGKKVQYGLSGMFTALEEYGQSTLKKNAAWLKFVPFAGKWLLGDVEKSLSKRAEEAKKKEEGEAKKNKSAKDKAKKDLESKEKKAEDALKKAEIASNKKVEVDNLKEKMNREKKLGGFMTSAEQYAFKHGDAEAKQSILKIVEDDLPVREEKKKAREYESMLMTHMDQKEQEEFKTLDLDAKKAMLAKVGSELAARAPIAEANQNKKGQKGGGGKGKGGGGPRGGPRTK